MFVCQDRQRPPAGAGHASVLSCPGGASGLVIDGWLVQPMLNLLSRDGVTVRLRAQLMDLLVCLASRPGQVLRKEDLVAEVWEGRTVAGSAFSRCISELRAAIGDEAKEPRVIETITKRGYRIVAPVTVLSAGTTSSPVASGRS